LPAALRLPGGASGLPDDDRRLLDLTHRVADEPRLAAVQRLDRLAVGVSRPRVVLRAGRQAVTWGNGLVFHPLDVVSPFSPFAIDRDYKTGDDMLYGQGTLGETTDVQAIVLPRRDPATGSLRDDRSSYAAKLRFRAAGADLDLLAARHAGEPLVGVGAARSVGGAVWRLDASYVDLAGAGGAVSLVTNVDYSWSAFGRNLYGYAEYFRSGAGEADRAGYRAPRPALVERLARGELFTLARDYLAAGLRVELTPLLNVLPTIIWNLDDSSLFGQLRAVYDRTERLRLLLGVELPAGPRGSEFGGVPSGVPGRFVGPGRAVFVQAAYEF
ncbi:MAG TPA: hypothetical protein VNM66_03820, partial [Thermodesulfobacteriota bacterium]|nr:hypothetical protein [Thermodesulfobacteriota bacterium]